MAALLPHIAELGCVLCSEQSVATKCECSLTPTGTVSEQKAVHEYGSAGVPNTGRSTHDSSAQFGICARQSQTNLAGHSGHTTSMSEQRPSGRDEGGWSGGRV